jgi:hypothetical protein
MQLLWRLREQFPAVRFATTSSATAADRAGAFA